MFGNTRRVHFMNVKHIKTDTRECNNTFFFKCIGTKILRNLSEVVYVREQKI